MKVIIAGSRGLKEDRPNYVMLCEVVRRSGFDVTEVVSGRARGADALGEMWAELHHVPVTPFPVTKADWATYGRAAGHRRNAQMGAYAQALIALWDGASPGTKGMIADAKRRGLPVYVHKYEP